MTTDLRRGWILFALALGLVFQLVQFIRSQKAILSTYNVGVEGSHPSTADASTKNPQPESSSAPKVSIDLSQQILAKIADERQFDDGISQEIHDDPDQGHVDVRSVLGRLTFDLAPTESTESFEPSKFNFSQPAIPTEYTLPPPRYTNQSTVVICLSARDNFERRAVIRETWAKGNDNVYFVIGGPVPGDEKDTNKDNPLSTSSLLVREQERFNDIIDTIHPDTYKSLPYKLHYSMRWIMKNLDNVNWIVKADDDCVVRVRLLQYFVLRQMNPYHPMVIGTVAAGSKPHRSGKWAEDPKFTESEYPPWCFGSAGYVVSRPVAQYVADNDLYYYQGEDAGLGIWLIQSPLQVTWIDSPELRKDEGCVESLFVIGHDLNVEAIRTCFEKLGDEVPDRKHIIAFSAGRKDQFPGRIQNPI